MTDYTKHLYKHQQEAILEKTQHPKCLINMWCGTGKTRTFTLSLFMDSLNTNVIVFPSLGLINQYNNDYFLSDDTIFSDNFSKYKCLAFCSEDDSKLKKKSKQITYTTKETTCSTFLKKTNHKLILVTYNSFPKFVNICIDNNIRINRLIYDEAHHIVGDNIQGIVFNNPELDNIVDKTEFYTATPVNRNGITMYNRDEPENSDCGPLAYEYLYYRAVEDKVCKAFMTQISLYCELPEYKNKYQPIFELIIRGCLSGSYNFWNVLTYHSYVNECDDKSDSISSVNEFSSHQNQKLVKQLFTKIQNEEFPDTKSLYTVDNVILKGVHSETRTRVSIIKDFDRKVPGRIYILSSCGILNEGIDTKWANMGVPINPSQSIVKESQRIGRLVRIPELNMPDAIMMIPCLVDITKYGTMETDEQQDEMIRTELSKTGNFKTALNVISAFKYQYDPELYEMCLRYPNMYAPQEVKDNLKKHGLDIEETQGGLIDNIQYICDKEDLEIDLEDKEDLTDDELLEYVSENLDKTIEIHTQNHDEPIRSINNESSDDEPLRLFYSEDDKEYSPITKMEKKQKAVKKGSITAPKKRNPIFNVHSHPDLDIRWKISGIKLNNGFGQGVLDVDINWNEVKWYENLEELKGFIDDNKKKPNADITRIQINGKRIKKELTNNNDISEKRLGSWLSHQVNNHKKKSSIMSDQSIYNKWTDFINNSKYSNYFIDNKTKWEQDLTELKAFMDDKHYRPNQISKIPSEKRIGKWLSHQLKNHKKKTQIMSDQSIYNKWTDFINNSKYSNYFIDNNTKWEQYLSELKTFIDDKHHRPNQISKIPSEKRIGQWLSTQLKNHKKKCYIISDQSIYDKWTDFITDPKYSDYFINNKTKWQQNLSELKTFIDDKEDRPNNRSKISSEKRIAMWMSTQITNYKNKSTIMSDQSIYDKWTEFITDPKYSDYFVDNNTKWEQDLSELKTFLDDKHDRPKQNSKIPSEKRLAEWISTQLANYKKKTQIMTDQSIYDKWTEFITDPIYSNYFIDNNTKWEQDLSELKTFIDDKEKRPNNNSTILSEKRIASWLSNQLKNHKKKTKIMKDQLIHNKWTDFTTDPNYSEYFPNNSKYFQTNQPKKDMYKPVIKPKQEKSDESPQIKKQRIKSELSELHKKYKTMNSQNLHNHFKENTDDWDAYHNISKKNEESFPEEEIPRNLMIQYLEKLPGKKKKVIADLGCGFAEINEHFKDNNRFEFHNFDHVSDNETIQQRDIKNTELEDYSVDIAILSLAMWGSNCKEYISEAYRILDTGGTLLISEPYKRWYDEETKESKLVKLLEANNFTIIENREKKFVFIEARKN